MLQKWPLFYYHYYNYYSIEMGKKKLAHSTVSVFILPEDRLQLLFIVSCPHPSWPATDQIKCLQPQGLLRMYLWWGLRTFYLLACQLSYRRQLRSLLLVLCDLSRAQINSLVWGFATTGKWWRKLVVVSNWILIFHQLHRVTSGQFNKKAPFKTLLIYMRSQIHKTSALS